MLTDLRGAGKSNKLMYIPHYDSYKRAYLFIILCQLRLKLLHMLGHTFLYDY